PLGFGAAQLGNLYRITTDEEADGAVAAAWDAGIRYFDTAPHYGIGTSERRLGQRLARYPREEYLVSTKVGRVLRPGPGTGNDSAHGFAVPDDHVREWDFSEAGVRRSHAESLDRLGLDRVDILFAHDPEEGPTQQAFDEGLPALARMRDEGLVRAIGVGSKDADVLLRAVRTGLIDLVMLSGRARPTSCSRPASSTAWASSRSRYSTPGCSPSTRCPTTPPTSTPAPLRRSSSGPGRSPASPNGTARPCRTSPSSSRCATRPCARSCWGCAPLSRCVPTSAA